MEALLLNSLNSGLFTAGVGIVSSFVNGMIGRDHSAKLAAQNRASQEAMCRERLKSQAIGEAARREIQERIEEKRQKFQTYMENERRNFQRELEQSRQESQFILETRRQDFQRQMEEKRRKFQLELEKDRQEFQAYLESNRQQFQLEVNKSNAELQRELSAQNHAFRLEEINANFELTRRTQEYQQVEAKWPLHVPPVVMRGEQVLKDRTIALRVLFARSSDAYLQKFFYPIIEQELVDFIDIYKNNLNSRNIIFFHNAWKDEYYGGAFGNNIHFALSDLPVLIADANVLPSGQIRISVTMWGVGSDTEFHGNIFKCPYDKARFKDENYVLEMAYKVSAYLKFAIGYVYDLYNLIAYNRMPLLPAAVSLEKANLVDSALLNYDEVKQCLTDTCSRMYSQTLSITDGNQLGTSTAQAEDVKFLIDSKKTILHELRLNYALAVKDYVSAEQYLQYLDESIRAWVDLRTDKSAEEFLQELADNDGKEVDKYFSDEDKRYFVKLCDAYYENEQKNELIKICLRLSVYVNGKAATRYYIEAAKQGEAEAQYCMGVCFETHKNCNYAIEWYRKAAEQGHAGAQYKLSYVDYDIDGNDYDEAVKWYLKAAEGTCDKTQTRVDAIEQETKEQEEHKKADGKLAALRKAAEDGDAEAQYSLGRCYHSGDGVDEDRVEAVKWFRKAAEQGHAEAQYKLGNSYYYKSLLGIQRDDYREIYANGWLLGFHKSNNLNEAAKWYRKSAEQGYAKAQYMLGEYCLYFVKNDVKAEAAKWYRKAAEQGHAKAQYKLGECYYYCWGTKKDEVEAAKWYHKAAEQGHAEAQYKLSKLYSSSRGTDKEEALKYLYKAADQGYWSAIWDILHDNLHPLHVPYEIQKLYKHHNCEKDSIKVVRKLAEQGLAEAQFYLGKLYGDFDPSDHNAHQDDAKAAKWFRKAAEQGHAEAQYRLGQLYNTGCGVDLDKEEALKWLRKAAKQGQADAIAVHGILEEILDGEW